MGVICNDTGRSVPRLLQIMFGRMRSRADVRISIGPGHVAGYLAQLRKGFDQLGLTCEHFIYTSNNRFDYEEHNYFLKEKYEFVHKHLSSRSGVHKAAGWFIEKIIRLMALIRAIAKYDVFIFLGIGSFFRFLELPLLRLLGKDVVVVYLGSDARPPYLSGRYRDDLGDCFDPPHILREARAQIALIRRAERFASSIVNHTGTAQFFSRPFIRLNALGMPMETAATQTSVNGDRPDGRVRIVHAPSRPRAKGTELIRAAVKACRQDGYSVELVELHGVPNSKVIEELQKCDLVIDELYSDVPMAMLAAEAATFAKPVIVGSYYLEGYANDNPDERRPPVEFIQPGKLNDAIRKLLDDPLYRKELGLSAQEFVSEVWAPKVVASNYLRLMTSAVPDHWWCHPKSLNYVMGWGHSRESWNIQLRNYIDSVGVDGLLMKNRPDLRESILQNMHEIDRDHQ